MEEKVPDYDTFGYCIRCGKRMVDMKVIDGIYKLKLSGEYTTVMYCLDNGSHMRVAMCQDCANNLKEDDEERTLVMAKVWRGWQQEVETYSHWDETKKKEYLELYSKRRILVRSDKLPQEAVDKIIEVYKKFEPKEVPHIIEDYKKNESKKVAHGPSN
jgi:hypothetical protein